ncbi:MAG: hypothetical protein H0X71_09070 [Rubrobacter sp.]|nr:hypothetical protein [Rubrobacter sp.]
MYSKVQRDRSLERSEKGLAGFSPFKPKRTPGVHPSPEITRRERAIIVEPHPAVQAVLEHLLLREGYLVEAFGKFSAALPGQTPVLAPPVLLLVGTGGGDGLYVFRTRDVAGVLAALDGEPELSEIVPSAGWDLSAFGIHAFVPKPFGIVDILRVIRAVGDFDERKKGPPKGLPGGATGREALAEKVASKTGQKRG